MAYPSIPDVPQINSTQSDPTTPSQKASVDAQGNEHVQNAPADGAKATYTATINGLVSVASATDIFTLTGSATKKVRVTRVEVNGQQTTAASALIVLLKRSVANLTGTHSAPTIVPQDSGSAAATATVLAYTANPGTLGTLIGNIRNAWLFLAAPATTAATEKLALDFGNRPAQAVVLNGIAEVFAINLNAATVTGGTFNVTVEWSEE